MQTCMLIKKKWLKQVRERLNYQSDKMNIETRKHFSRINKKLTEQYLRTQNNNAPGPSDNNN